MSLITQVIFLLNFFLTICLIPTNDYFIVGELSVNSWNLTKEGKSQCLGESPSCRQSRRWTKLSCSYLCCELRDPSQVTLAWQTIHTNSPNHLFLWARWKVCFISHTRLAVVWLSKMLCCLDWLWCVLVRSGHNRWPRRGGLTVRPVNPESPLRKQSEDPALGEEETPELLKRLLHSWD